MNGGESEKKGGEVLEICETGENILPENLQIFSLNYSKKRKMMKMNDNHQNRRNKTKMNQITNRDVKTDPVVDAKYEMKHDLAVLDARVREAPLS